MRVLATISVVVIIFLSAAASFEVGRVYHNRTNSTDANLCLTDKAIATTLAKSLAQATLADVRRYGVARWERARDQTIREIDKFRSIAPCDFDVAIPHDVAERLVRK